MVDVHNPFRRFRHWRNRPAPSQPATRAGSLTGAKVGRPTGTDSDADRHRSFAGNAGGHHRSTTRWPLTPEQVRQQQFPQVRRGLDASEVELFLYRVAADLSALQTELRSTRDENIRIKRALRDWQSRFTPGVRA
ncbi:DivIVA domain-containing protein [Salinispora pacifica]|uniref:DivIVA domain-containing protein n=1 Tax=Salinispora pacifica TaxID=351187 RepID=UPI00037572DC|nr:DivIVA domain-containing protein [Salinispora pacifica]